MNEKVQQFKNLQLAATKEINSRYDSDNAETETPEKLKSKLSWYGKTYKGTFEQQRTKFLKWRELQRKKELDELNREIIEVENAGSFSGQVTVTVEWTRSYMWGSNPTATDNYGRNSGSIGGCGYDKLSTAVARVLNQNLSLLYDLWSVKEKALKSGKYIGMSHNKMHRKVLGYGSGYNALPKFEGGVGISSQQMIIENIGLEWENITSTNNVDVFRISKPD